MQVTDSMLLAAQNAFREHGYTGANLTALRAALTAALSDQERAVEVAIKPLNYSGADGWHRSDNEYGGVMLYTLREDGWRKGQPVMVNDVTIRIERAHGSEADVEAIVRRVGSALVDVPVEPAAWALELEGAIIATTFKPDEAAYMKSANANCDLVPLFAHPPLSHRGEDSAEVVEAAIAVLSSWDQRMSGSPEEKRKLHGTDHEYWSPAASMVSSDVISRLRAALAATRSGSDFAITAKGCAE